MKTEHSISRTALGSSPAPYSWNRRILPQAVEHHRGQPLPPRLKRGEHLRLEQSLHDSRLSHAANRRSNFKYVWLAFLDAKGERSYLHGHSALSCTSSRHSGGRPRGRRQPCCRTRRYQVEGEARPCRAAGRERRACRSGRADSRARVTKFSIARTSAGVSRTGDVLGQED
jgi:hypothetical protein